MSLSVGGHSIVILVSITQLCLFFFQFCPVSLPLRGTYFTPAYHNHPHISLQVLPSIMDNSARNRMSAPSNPQNSHNRLSEPGTSSKTTSVGDNDGRIDQLALVKNTLQNGATPTLVAVIAILLAQMKALEDHADLVLTVSSGIGSLLGTAFFQDGIGHGYDLTHSIDDQASDRP